MRIFISLPLLLTIASGSLFNPHLFPNHGPFFEGWYMRISDIESNQSIGVLFGSTLPESGHNVTNPLAIASLLWRNCADNQSDCKLTSNNARVHDLRNLNITVNGSQVEDQPDVNSPPDFVWRFEDSDSGFFQQDGGETKFQFQIGDLNIDGEATSPHWWNKDQTGPEGWLGYLPLPLHWFVYSVGSNLTYFRLHNVTSGETLESRHGSVHLEKNWGASFPRRWIWSQGVARDDSRASFAISGGLVDLSVTSVNAYLIGFKNPAKGLELSFRPDNSIVWSTVRGCSGTVHVTVYSLWYKLEMSLRANVDTFSECLLGPEMYGFSRACVESYDADAVISVWKLVPFRYKLIDKVLFRNIGLEFGGENVCNNKCAGQKYVED